MSEPMLFFTSALVAGLLIVASLRLLDPRRKDVTLSPQQHKQRVFNEPGFVDGKKKEFKSVVPEDLRPHVGII